MAGIKKISQNNKVYALIVPASLKKAGTSFFSQAEDNFQLGQLFYEKGHKVAPHLHRLFKRIILGTSELFSVAEGKVRVNVFDEAGKKIKSVVLNKGDTILLLAGGHGLDFLARSQILMLKQGPYSGKAEDKAYLK